MSRKYLLSLLFLFAVGGCSLLLKEDTFQCSDDSDCKAFKNTRCDRSSHVCKLDVSVGGGGGQDAAPEAGNSCTVSTQCNKGEVCVQEVCKSITTPECPKSIGSDAISDSKVRWLGMIAPLGAKTPEDYMAEETLRAIGFVHEQYSAAETSISTIDPVVVVVCDEHADANKVLDHLASLEINVIVGPQTAAGLFTLLPLVKDREMTLVSPLVDDVRVESGTAAIDAVQNGKYFSVRPNRRREIKAFIPALEKAREMVKAKVGGTAFDTLKPVLLWDKNNEDSVAFRDELVQIAPSWNYIEFGGLGTETDVATKVVAAAPNFVVAASPEEVWADVFLAIETAYQALPDGGTTVLPYYFTPGELDLMSAKITFGLMAERTFSLPLQRPAASNDIYKAYTELYRSKYPGDPPPFTEYAADAFLLSNYVNRAAIKLGVSAANVRKALLDLSRPPGNPISLMDYTNAAGAVFLASDIAGDFQGASGNLDISDKVGSPSEIFTLRCFPPGIKAEDYCDTGFVLDPSQDPVVVTGSPNAACVCP